MFLGFTPLEGTVYGLILTATTGQVPTDAASAPTYRIYGPDGLMANGTGVSVLRESGTITAASNASPIVITSANHGLNTGTRLTISGVLGNTAANGSFTITRVDANTFSLDGSTGNGDYISGGTWHPAGLYGFSFPVSASNGYTAGQTYSIVLSYTVSSTAQAQEMTFQVS